LGRVSRVPPAAAVFVLSFIVYAFCAYPAIAPRDSADLALAAVRLSVAHPPGYPLYALLGRLWLFLLPLGDAAWRLNILSALAGALAAALLTRACESRGRAAAWGAGLCFAFCAPLWKFSLLEEMYSLQAAFLAGLLLLSEGERESFVRRAALSGLLFGLGCVNHQTLVLSAPAWLWLWRMEARRHGVSLSSALRAALPLSAAGLLLDLWVPWRLGDWRLGWAVLTRAEYGPLTLSGTLARPFVSAAPGLLSHFAAGTAAATTPLLLAAAAAAARARGSRGRGGAVILGLAASLAFALLSRLDVSSWVSRTVLETAFLMPAFWLCVAAAEGLSALSEVRPGAAAAFAAVLALLTFAGHARDSVHRDDFSAADYADNLRRTLPPGSAAVVRGDTALFSLKLTAPDRAVVSELEPDWIARLAAAAGKGRPLYAVGLPADAVLAAFPKACPAGLALSLDGRCADLWPLYAIRMGEALSRRESYARDPALSYAFAHATAEKLAKRDEQASYHALWAAAWDPDDFGLRMLSTGERR
jgi:hypothetical protein